MPRPFRQIGTSSAVLPWSRFIPAPLKSAQLAAERFSSFGFTARVPLALLAVGIYLLGTVTGGTLLALLQSIEGAKRRTAGTL